MSITIQHIQKRFGDFTALNDVSLQVEKGELTALLGPSGSGKTTLLRIVAGLESADGGSIEMDGHDICAQSVQERGIGFVFQHYALFRHMNVFENVAFGLRVLPKKERPQEAEIRARVRELLELVQLEYLASHYPHELSGGQRQRIALARALAIKPKILLLDEPFGALDAKVRKELRTWLRRLHDDTGVTSLFVTHDQDEALEVADKIVVMGKGKVEQIGTPQDVYEHPANAFVYSFLGDVNIFHGRSTVSSSVLAVRPHDITLSRERNEQNRDAAIVLGVRIVGGHAKIALQTDESRSIDVLLSSSEFLALGLKEGETCFYGFSHEREFQSNEQWSDYVI